MRGRVSRRAKGAGEDRMGRHSARPTGDPARWFRRGGSGRLAARGLRGRPELLQLGELLADVGELLAGGRGLGGEGLGLLPVLLRAVVFLEAEQDVAEVLADGDVQAIALGGL